MPTQKWDPFRDIVSLRDAMNTLFDDSVVRPRAGAASFFQVGNAMPLDLRETPGAYIVELVAAGATPNDVELSILGDTLRISAVVKDREAQEGEVWLVRERRFGTFERTVTLPAAVKADEATAEFDHGILRITLPRADVARPRQIPVRVIDGATSITRSDVSGLPQPVEVAVGAESETRAGASPSDTGEHAHATASNGVTS